MQSSLKNKSVLLNETKNLLTVEDLCKCGKLNAYYVRRLTDNGLQPIERQDKMHCLKKKKT